MNLKDDLKLTNPARRSNCPEPLAKSGQNHLHKVQSLQTWISLSPHHHLANVRPSFFIRCTPQDQDQQHHVHHLHVRYTLLPLPGRLILRVETLDAQSRYRCVLLLRAGKDTSHGCSAFDSALRRIDTVP
jgi:hypothetical protein